MTDNDMPLADKMISQALREERREPDVSRQLDELGKTAHRIADQRNDLLRSLIDAEAMLRGAATRVTNVHPLLARDLHEAANYARAAIGRAKS